jgi:hypothetical protein
MLIRPGNAAGLFPTIGPSHAASPEPSAVPQAQASKRKAGPVSVAEPISSSSPVMTAQAAGLMALGLAIMLTVTRLSIRKRRQGKPPT